MRQPRSVAVDEFVEHEVAFDHVVAGVVDFLGHAIEIFDLHAGQRLGRFAAGAGQGRMGVSPLVQFVGPLLLSGGHRAARSSSSSFVRSCAARISRSNSVCSSREEVTGCGWLPVDTSSWENKGGSGWREVVMNKRFLVIESLRARSAVERLRSSDERGNCVKYWLWNLRLSTRTPTVRQPGDTLRPIQNRHHETTTFREDCHQRGAVRIAVSEGGTNATGPPFTIQLV